MIRNSILFYYKNDHCLGDYFYNSAVFAISLLNQENTIKQSHVVDNNCNFAYIEGTELLKHNEKSLFLIYSHGDNHGFYKSNDTSPFIHSSIDCDICLNGGLVYTNSCSTGTQFGKALEDKNASFFGYTKSVIKDPRYERVYIECDNWGLHYLMKGSTLTEAKKETQNKFNLEIDACDNMFTASNLRDARDCLVIYGNLTTRLI